MPLSDFRSYLLPVGISGLLLIAAIQCDRWKEPARPMFVDSSASYDRKRGLWLQTVDGLHTAFYEDGSIAWRGQTGPAGKQGKWKWYAPDNGPLTTEGIYESNRRVGTWKHFDDSGRLYMTIEYKLEPFDAFISMMHSDYGNENGKVVRYFPDGSVEMEGSYVAGKESGKFVTYFQNGQIQMTGHYSEGQKDGTFRYYRSDGELRRIENYSNGILDGPYRNYRSDGKLHSETVYKKGEIAESRILPKK